MMPQTVPDGFEFEQFPGDEPGRTLHGGHAGDSPILAEQVQSKFVTTDSQIADLTSRVAALENGTSGPGWVPIATGASSGGSFTIDLSAGGKFPSPPMWRQVRVTMRVDMSTPDLVLCRVNGDADAVYRSGSATFDSQVPASIDADNWHAAAATTWRVALLSTISTGLIDMDLYHTNVNPGLLSFQARSSRQSDDPSAHRHTIASGSLVSAKTLQSLQFIANGSTTFVDCWWTALGLRL